MFEFKELQENFEYPDAKRVTFKEKDIFIKQYLPSGEKYQLIFGCLTLLGLHEKSYNPLLSEILFEYELVRAYSNIIFDENHKNVFKTYDVLELNGIIELVVDNIPVEEYEEIFRLYEESVQYAIQYNGQLGAVINNILQGVPGLVEEAAKTMENFDEEGYLKAKGMLDKLVEEKHI